MKKASIATSSRSASSAASTGSGKTAASFTRPRFADFSWSEARTRALVWQTALVVVVLIAGVLVIGQTATNLKTRGIASGFHYLARSAGFEIARGPLPYSSRDPYVWALFVGVANTLRVTVAGIILATILGGIVGIARSSKIAAVSSMARIYTEAMRNTPLLLQLLFWYALTRALPDPRHAWQPLGGVFLCFRGLYLPALRWHGVSGWFSIEYPAFAGFDFHGGISMTPEFVALLIGLSTCTAAFIGEIVRGGILAVDRGQADAAAALGLSRATALRRVILPQAMRLILPPVTSQFVNVAKNSSLAVAIGYPDVISITNTTVNQTGQAIEALAIAMLVYLAISLTIALPMNAWERAVVMRGESAAS